MPVTEIYSCKAGQKLKEGRLDLSHDIDSKEQAEADARRRCQLDPSLGKVAYYQVREDGSFRLFYSYTNPGAATAPKPAAAAKPRKPRRKPPPKRGWWQRLRRLLGF